MHIQVSPMTCVLGSLQAESGEAGYHFPCAELLSDGSVYICARKDRGMNDPYGRTEAVRYLPATGDLIPMPSPTARDLENDRSKAAYSCYVTELSPGELIAVYGLLEPAGRPVLFDEKTFGMCACALRLTRSHDGGRSWDKPEGLAYQTQDTMIPSKIYRSGEGIWGFHAEMHNHWEENYREPVQARFVYSIDGGKSFDRAAMIPHAPDFLAGDARPTIGADGRICVFFWGFDLKALKDLAVYRSFSADGGRSFSPVEPVCLKKQISSPFWLREDCYLCLYQERFSERPGLYAALSLDGGMTWDEEHAAEVFVSGSAPKSDNAFDSGNDQAYTFGYSTLTRLAPDRALAAFWRKGGESTCICVCEISVK